MLYEKHKRGKEKERESEKNERNIDFDVGCSVKFSLLSQKLYVLSFNLRVASE